MTIAWTDVPEAELRERLADKIQPTELAALGYPELIAAASLVLGPSPSTPPPILSSAADDLRAALARAERAVSRPVPKEDSSADAAMERWRDQTDAVPPVTAGLPALGEFQMLEHMAIRLARSSLVPQQFRHKPDDLLVVLLQAHDYGLTTSMVLSEVAVIDGKPAKSAYLLRFLVRRDGHKLWVTIDRDTNGRPVAATAFGIRKDDPTTTYDVRFTIDDAVAAGLCQLRDGKVWARSQGGKVLPWELYTEDLLVARATSRLCRRCFEDSIGGAAYTPEELGVIDTEGAESDVPRPSPEPSPLDDLSRDELKRRLDALTPELREEVKQVWVKQHFPPLPQLTTNHWGPIDAIITAREKRMPEDAVEVNLEDDAALVIGTWTNLIAAVFGPAAAPVTAPAAAANHPTANVDVCLTCGAATSDGEPHIDGCDQAPM